MTDIVIRGGGGGGGGGVAVFCSMCNIFMCGHKGYEFLAVLVINVSILAILVLNRVWFLHSSAVRFLRRSCGTVFKKKLLFHHYR